MFLASNNLWKYDNKKKEQWVFPEKKNSTPHVEDSDFFMPGISKNFPFLFHWPPWKLHFFLKFWHTPGIIYFFSFFPFLNLSVDILNREAIFSGKSKMLKNASSVTLLRNHQMYKNIKRVFRQNFFIHLMIAYVVWNFQLCIWHGDFLKYNFMNLLYEEYWALF